MHYLALNEIIVSQGLPMVIILVKPLVGRGRGVLVISSGCIFCSPAVMPTSIFCSISPLLYYSYSCCPFSSQFSNLTFLTPTPSHIFHRSRPSLLAEGFPCLFDLPNAVSLALRVLGRYLTYRAYLFFYPPCRALASQQVRCILS